MQVLRFIEFPDVTMNVETTTVELTSRSAANAKDSKADFAQGDGLNASIDVTDIVVHFDRF